MLRAVFSSRHAGHALRLPRVQRLWPQEAALGALAGAVLATSQCGASSCEEGRGGPGRSRIPTPTERATEDAQYQRTFGGTLRVDLWPNGVPDLPAQVSEEEWWDTAAGGDRAVSGVSWPDLTVYFPASASQPTTAVVVCPGGGYSRLAYDKEGVDIAKWLAKQGVVGIVLKYRTHDNICRAEALLGDVRKAFQLVRSHAADWGVDPQRVGIMGVSAGGHLASSASVLLGDDAPAFSVLLYPIVSMQQEMTHAASRANLLGDSPSEQLVERFSAHMHVEPSSPPAILIHAGDDAVAKADNSLAYYQALRKAGVPAELHVFRAGGHGAAMRTPQTAFGMWPQLLLAWMRETGLAAL